MVIADGAVRGRGWVDLVKIAPVGIVSAERAGPEDRTKLVRRAQATGDPPQSPNSVERQTTDVSELFELAAAAISLSFSRERGY